MVVLDLQAADRMSKERRQSERYETPSIPVQLSDIDGSLIDLSIHGAAVIHRSPMKPGSACTLIFPSYGGIYIPCQVLRSIVQVRQTDRGAEYVFRSAITFLPMTDSERGPLEEFIHIQIARLDQVRAEHRAQLETQEESDPDQRPPYAG